MALSPNADRGRVVQQPVEDRRCQGHVREDAAQVSVRLALGQDGWLLTLGFCGLGLGSLLLARLLHATLPDFPVLAILIAVAGALNLVAAVVHTDANGVSMTIHGLIHNMVGLLSFLLYLAELIVASSAFRTSPT